MSKDKLYQWIGPLLIKASNSIITKQMINIGMPIFISWYFAKHGQKVSRLFLIICLAYVFSNIFFAACDRFKIGCERYVQNRAVVQEMQNLIEQRGNDIKNAYEVAEARGTSVLVDNERMAQRICESVREILEGCTGSDDIEVTMYQMLQDNGKLLVKGIAFGTYNKMPPKNFSTPYDKGEAYMENPIADVFEKGETIILLDKHSISKKLMGTNETHMSQGKVKQYIALPISIEGDDKVQAVIRIRTAKEKILSSWNYSTDTLIRNNISPFTEYYGFCIEEYNILSSLRAS